MLPPPCAYAAAMLLASAMHFAVLPRAGSRAIIYMRVISYADTLYATPLCRHAMPAAAPCHVFRLRYSAAPFRHTSLTR